MRKALVCVILLSLLPALGTAALTVTANAPGSCFVAGKPLEFRIGAAKGEIRYRLTDYFSAETSRGSAPKGDTNLRLPGLAPGHYSLVCTDGSAEVTVPIAVLMDRGRAPLPADGRICADSASASLLKKEEQRKPYAEMLRLAGIPWVRERLSWPETQRSPGPIEWGLYQTTADTLAAQGIRICQVVHQTPKWAQCPAPRSQCPKDLRDLYRYMKAAASRFPRQMQAMEVWNEVDIFWPGLGDLYAGTLKASYLGLKAGNPDLQVLISSFSQFAWEGLGGKSSYGATAEAVFANGVGDYFDVFNWHAYLDPGSYPAALSDYRALMRRYHCAERPSWLTEVGRWETATEPSDPHILKPEAQRSQCRFVPRSVVMALAAGTEKYFWFILPDYMEGPNQFGMLRRDLTPYPGFVALSAAANILAQADYLGEYPLPEADAHLLKTPNGNVLVAWATNPGTIHVPTEKRSVQVANIFGATSRVMAKDGSLTLAVGPEAVYVLDVGRSILPRIRMKEPPREKPLPPSHPSKTVLAGHCELPIEMGYCSLPSPPTPFRYIVEAYQLDENNGASGTVEVTAPTGWQVENPKRELKLGPMGREVLEFKITPDSTGDGVLRITTRGRFGSPAASPTVSFIKASH